MLKVSGPVDSQHSVVKRARELVQGTRSRAMIRSFDEAVKSGLLASEE
jgi:hypothetical protein